MATRLEVLADAILSSEFNDPEQLRRDLVGVLKIIDEQDPSTSCAAEDISDKVHTWLSDRFTTNPFKDVL